MARPITLYLLGSITGFLAGAMYVYNYHEEQTWPKHSS